MLRKIAVMLAMVCMCFSNAYASYPYENVCPEGGEVFEGIDFWKKVYDERGNYLLSKSYWVDKWSFAQCNCTSYCAYMLNEYGIDFNNGYKGVTWSHGKYWGDKARSVGICNMHRHMAVFPG